MSGDRVAEERWRRSTWSPVWEWAAWAGTMAMVGLGWVLFRATSLDEAGLYLARLFSGGSGIESLDPGQVALVLALGVPFIVGQSRIGSRLERRARRWRHAARGAVAGCLFALAYALSLGESRVFIYFQF